MSYKTILDHIIELNDKMMLEKERQSRNKYFKKLKVSRRQAREGEKIMIGTIEELYQKASGSPMTIAEFIAQINTEKVKLAVANCKAFHQYEEEGTFQELEARYSTFRKYTPRFLSWTSKPPKALKTY